MISDWPFPHILLCDWLSHFWIKGFQNQSTSSQLSLTLFTSYLLFSKLIMANAIDSLVDNITEVERFVEISEVVIEDILQKQKLSKYKHAKPQDATGRALFHGGHV